MPIHDHFRKNLKFHSKICFQNLNKTALQSKNRETNGKLNIWKSPAYGVV